MQLLCHTPEQAETGGMGLAPAPQTTQHTLSILTCQGRSLLIITHTTAAAAAASPTQTHAQRPPVCFTTATTTPFLTRTTSPAQPNPAPAGPPRRGVCGARGQGGSCAGGARPCGGPGPAGRCAPGAAAAGHNLRCRGGGGWLWLVWVGFVRAWVGGWILCEWVSG